MFLSLHNVPPLFLGRVLSSVPFSHFHLIPLSCDICPILYSNLPLSSLAPSPIESSTTVPPAGIFPISVVLSHGFGVTSNLCVPTGNLRENRNLLSNTHHGFLWHRSSLDHVVNLENHI